MTSAFDLSRARAVVRRLADASPTEVALLGTPIVLLVNARHDPVTLAASLALLAATWASARLRVAPALWLATAALVGFRQAQEFILLDDHVVLTTYWCAAIGLSLLTSRREAALQVSAALLVALAFLFAAGWKASSAEYRSGEFFATVLVLDQRFAPLSERAVLAEPGPVRQEVADAIDARDGGTVTWTTRPGAHVAIWGITLIGLGLEAVVGLAFLVRGRVLDRVGTVAMVGFSAIYLLVIVTGFATLVAVLAGTATNDQRWRRAFIALGLFWLVWTPIRVGALTA